MLTPGMFLPKLTKSLLRLKKATSFLDDTSGFDHKLNLIIRKSRIAQILSGRNMIAIAGSQGAGKSTFLKNLYELDNSWIIDNQGRGEKVPLLVIEKNGISEPEGWIEEIDENGEIIEHQIIDHEDFKTLLKGLSPQQIQPILYVPTRFFGGNEVGFVLLPGYESINSTNQEFQEQMRHALIASFASIIVTDKTKLAESTQKKIIDDLNEHCLEGSKPIIVITKTEGLTNEVLANLMQSATEMFTINSDEKERIVCIGSNEDKEYCDRWRYEIENAVHKFTLISKTVRERQLTYLETLLRDDISDMLFDINDAKLSVEIDAAPAIKNELIELFKKSRDSIRRKYSNAIKENLASHTKKAQESANDNYIDNVEKKGSIDKCIDWWNTTSGERERQRQKRITESWNNPSKESSFSDIFPNTLEKITFDQLQISNVQEKQEKPNLIEYHEKKFALTSPKLNDEIQIQIKSLFSKSFEASKKEDDSLDNTKKALDDAIKILPVLALEYARINTICLKSIDISTEESSNTNLIDAFQSTKDTLTEFANNHSNVIKGIAAMLALDAVDGEIDSIPALFNAISKILTGSAASSTAGMITSGVVVSGFVILSVMNEMRKYDMEQRQFIANTIDSLRNQYYDHYMTFFDGLMDRLEETLDNRLNLRYKLHEKVGYKDSLERAIADVKSMRTDYLEVVRS